MEDDDIGLVQVYTGTGKGKTTAALGLVLRASGHDKKSIIIQFMKGRKNHGEISAIENLPLVSIERYGRSDFVKKECLKHLDIELARKGLERAEIVISSGEYDIVVLDEINTAINFELLEIKEVIDIIHDKPSHVEIVLTGRNAPPCIINIADLVTIMSEVKHPYMQGIHARKGIEY